MSRRSPEEERKFQQELREYRENERRAIKENAMERIRTASSWNDLREALADYLEEYT